MKKLILALAATSVLFSAQAAEAITLNLGTDPSQVLDGGVRFKGFTTKKNGDREFYLGVPDLGVGSNRVETDLKWNNPGTQSFELNYNPVTGIFDGTIKGKTLSMNIGNVGIIDYMQFDILSRHDDTSVALNNLVLNGENIGNLSATGNNPFSIYLSDISYANGFTLTGDLYMDSDVSISTETNKVEIGFGATPVPEPTSMLLGALGIAGAMGFRRKK